MQEFSRLLDLFTSHLEKYNSGLEKKQPAELYEPERYILSLGGKRIRPVLALAACDLFGKDPSEALHSAVAVELFHNFSLIHDDILDAAPLRRNQPTVHTKWNTNIAILSGDVMLVKAFQALEHYPPEQFKQLCKLFHETAIQVCEGQQVDMNFETSIEVSVDDYISMITYKTAVLLGCSLRMGAINAQASEKDQHSIYEFGKNLGIAFQLLDDCLDAFAPAPEKFGKQKGGDILSNKKTFLLLKAIERANPAQRKEMEELMKLPDAEKKVSDMLRLYNSLGVEKLCLNEADKYTAKAIGALEETSAQPAKKEMLRKFALDLLKRQT